MKEVPEGFTKVCKLNELKEGLGKRAMIDEVDVAIFKVEEKVYALQNVCTHQHAPIIYDGFIEDGKVYCPAHDWGFNLCDGKLGGKSKGLDSYEVKIIGDDVYVKAFSKKMNW
ncbi:MAG: Rieske 2Fe-2S domain-containing protein [Chlorobi bacterium]|nr:Rieske 2Fe-2S domain-containing protein [Chlorobiota bacterium]